MGSGASVDSGLYTYRGNNSINGSIVEKYDSISEQWKKTEWLISRLNEIKENNISPTYLMIQTIVDNCQNCTIMTQNIDGLIHQVKNANIVELHGTIRESLCDNCQNVESMNVRICSNCNSETRPNIIRIGDELKVNPSSYVKRTKYDLILVIGTTLQFPYLRQIIGKSKSLGGKVIHINPDEHYNDEIREPHYIGFDLVKYKKVKNVRKNERFINKNSYEGLLEVFCEI